MGENRPVRPFGKAGCAAAVLALAAISGCGGSSPGAATTGVHCPDPQGIVSIGESIPKTCSFERLDGGVLRLADLAGKPAVINFWATWCTYCIAEMPELQRVYASLGGRVAFVGADLLGVEGETREAARKFATKTGARYTLIFDKGGILYSHFSARRVMPTTIFVRADGTVVFRQFGPHDVRQLRGLVRHYLGVG